MSSTIWDLSELTILAETDVLPVGRDPDTKKATLETLRAGIGIDGWIPDSATWTRTANTTFTVSGDRTAVFSKGTRIKVTDTTTKHFVVVASSHAAGTTTVTITGGSDYVLAGNPTARWYSYTVSPQGYPDFFNYSCQLDQGASTNIAKTTNTARFAVIGRTCFVHVNLSPTASGSAGSAISVTVPITIAQTFSVSTLGSGIYNDGGVLYRFLPAAASGTTLSFFATTVTANAYVGSNPSLAIASGDNLGLTAAYEF